MAVALKTSVVKLKLTDVKKSIRPEWRRTRPLFFLRGSAGRSKQFMEVCPTIRTLSCQPN